eukprot:4735898-Prymnesium_polylepis.1
MQQLRTLRARAHGDRGHRSANSKGKKPAYMWLSTQKVVLILVSCQKGNVSLGNVEWLWPMADVVARGGIGSLRAPC